MLSGHVLKMTVKKIPALCITTTFVKALVFGFSQVKACRGHKSKLHGTVYGEVSEGIYKTTYKDVIFSAYNT